VLNLSGPSPQAAAIGAPPTYQYTHGDIFQQHSQQAPPRQTDPVASMLAAVQPASRRAAAKMAAAKKGKGKAKGSKGSMQPIGSAPKKPPGKPGNSKKK